MGVGGGPCNRRRAWSITRTVMPEPSSEMHRQIEWTGERCVPWTDDWQVLYEHLHRYYFAADLADGMRVLDLGSGEGYGSAILAERAKHVLGIELDAAAVDHATTNYPLDNLEFRRASAFELDDLPDESFDLIVCFEVIEHVPTHDELLTLVRRLLTPNGLFFVSTPDRVIYSEAADYHNPYHVKELSRTEFDGLLGRFFAHRGLWGQRLAIGSTLEEVEAGSRPGSSDHVFVSRSGDRWFRHKPKPVPYLVAVASQAPLPDLPEFSLLNDPEAAALTVAAEPPAVPSTEVARRALDAAGDRLFELWEPERLRRQVGIFEAALAAEIDATTSHRKEIANLARRLDAASSTLDEARGHITLLQRQGNDVSQAAREVRDENAALREDNDAIRAQLDEILHSRAWRTIRRYRAIRGSLPF